MEKKHSHKCIPNNSERLPASLGMHKESKAISKRSSSSSSNSNNNNKPKIRIIHIFAPQIIKTDVENFRELVQRKTGKPPTSAAAAAADMYKPTAILAASGGGTEQHEYYYSSRRSNNNSNSALNIGDDKPKSKNKKIMVELRNKFAASVVKEEQVCSISDEISSGGYLGGFSDLEEEQGFISELGGFSMLPLD